LIVESVIPTSLADALLLAAPAAPVALVPVEFVLLPDLLVEEQAPSTNTAASPSPASRYQRARPRARRSPDGEDEPLPKITAIQLLLKYFTMLKKQRRLRAAQLNQRNPEWKLRTPPLLPTEWIASARL
jgi:hypothetical protein